MDALPPSDVRERLVSALANIVRKRGFEWFLSAPILLPNDACFPDALEPGPAGVGHLARRLLHYAALETHSLSIRVYRDIDAWRATTDGGSFEAWSQSGAAVWLINVDEHSVTLGATSKVDARDERVLGQLAHEVAEAYRVRHAMTVTDPTIERQLADVTAAYLGFDVLVLNHAYRYRASGHVSGGYAYTKWSHEFGTALAPQDLAFLMAVHAVARSMDDDDRRQLSTILETNQRQFFETACEWLEESGDALLEALELPPASSFPHEIDITERTSAYAAMEAPPVTIVVASEEPEDDDVAARRPVFRVPVRKTGMGSLAGILLGGVAGGIGGNALSNGSIVFVGMALGLGLGALLGRRSIRHECSDPDCVAVIPVGSDLCPRCRRPIRGTIAKRSQRLAQEEALEQAVPRGYRDR